ncbi:unnamed protein product, partial [Didymodactylos carnosus]
MVQKYQSPVRVYRYPFELVMAAYEKRFPTCPMIPVFLGSDIISDYKSEDGAIEIIERRCRLNIDAPYLLKKIAGVDTVIFLQKNHLDRRQRTLKIDACNESFASRLIIKECCHYYVHPENSLWTCFEQSAFLDIKSFFGFEITVEKIAMKQYSSNLSKGKEVIEHYVSEITAQCKQNIPQWQPSLSSLTSITTENNINSHRELESKKSTSPTLEATRRHLSFDSTNFFPSSSPPHMSTIATASEYSANIDSLTNDLETFQLESIVNEKIVDNIDDEYIQRYIGILDPYEESCLVQLRNWVAETYKEKMPNDSHLLRFLRACRFDIEKTREFICHSLAWRKKNGIDKLLLYYEVPEVIQKYFPGRFLDADRDGRPIFILRLGEMDVRGLMKSLKGEDEFIRYTIYLVEQGLQKCNENTKLFGKPISSMCLILDFENFSVKHLYRPGFRLLSQIIDVMDSHYPETLGKLIFTRSPKLFPVLWTIINTFIKERTKEKFVILKMDELVGYIDENNIPDFLGGLSTIQLPNAGLVPRSMYVNDEPDKFDTESTLFGENEYVVTTLKDGGSHEIHIPINQRGEKITYDFDILKGDCIFTIYRTSLLNVENSSSTLSTSAIRNSISTIIPSSTIGDKPFQENSPDVLKIMSLTCHDGDTHQQTFVCQQIGSYILQWKQYNPIHTSPFDFISSGHKTKIMFHYSKTMSRLSFNDTILEAPPLSSRTTTNADDDNHCIWYDQCGEDMYGKITNCFYNGTAKKLVDAEALDTFQEICGMYYNGSETYTCCSPDQIRTMSNQFGLAGQLIGRCPSCYHNFRTFFCSMSCNPEHSRFLTVKAYGQSRIYPDKTTVAQIYYTIAEDFVQRFLDSC